MANLAEIINHDSRGIFEIILNDVSQDPTVKSLEFAVNKGNIIEVIKVKPLDINGEFPDNQITLKWQYSYEVFSNCNLCKNHPHSKSFY